MKPILGIASAVCISAVAACSNQLTAMLTPGLFGISVLPSDEPDGAHRVAPGGSIKVRVEVRMGQQVSTRGLVVSLGEPPPGVVSDSAMRTTLMLNAGATQVIEYNLSASEGTAPGQYSITVSATGFVAPEVGDTVVGDTVESTETTSFTLIVVAECPSSADFAGEWTGTFSCTSSCDPEGFSGEIVLTITQNGATASFTDSLGGVFTGTVCGNVLTFSGGEPGVEETGTLTLTSAATATKQSHYRNTASGCEGDCADVLTRE